MIVEVVLVVAVVIFAWGTVSARLEHADLTAPIVFVTVGALLAASGLVEGSPGPAVTKPLVELTLVWVLFADAAGVPVRTLRSDLGSYVRLLAVALPLTVLAGWGLAYGLFPSLGPWLSLLVGAALAPTDAALGLPVVANPRVPAQVRRLLTVESGLNDGIATPVVMVAIAGAAAAGGVPDLPGVGAAAAELGIGLLVGAGLGLAGGGTLGLARRLGWAAEELTGIAVLALALAAYAGALAAHGNGFIAAFCGGLAFGASSGRRGASALVFLEQAGDFFSLLVWIAFGAVALPIVAPRVDLATVAYAILSLTVVRMLPVAVAAIGSGLDRTSVLFVGWFGPRGLASLVFALLALEEFGDGADEAVAVVGVTVLLSVVAHGLSARPLADRFGDVEGTDVGSTAR